MKALIRFASALGPRTVVVEIGDPATAHAVVNAHLALGQGASLVEEMPRISLKDHMEKHKRAMAKAARQKAPAPASNVMPLKRRSRG